MGILRHLPRDGYVGATLLANATYHRLTPPPASRTRTLTPGPGTVLIVGGELFNKGAQAMTYTVVSEIAERYPEKDVVLLSTQDFERPKTERNQYTFEILPWPPNLRISFLRGGTPLERRVGFETQTLQRVNEVVESAECMIDINGYALSSQRGTRRSFMYLLNIMIARRRGIPFYVFPQSIGPFDYDSHTSLLMDYFLNTYLPYPAWVCPREQHGVKAVLKYRTANIRHNLDIVLTHGYDLENVFTEPPEGSVPTLPEQSVGIVPNMRVADRLADGEFEAIYNKVLVTLNENDRHPVVIQHSMEDEELCDRIATLSDEDLTIVTGDRQPFELERTIDQLDFLIGSRYHSVVHAFKRHVPAIVVGWAVKYRALLNEFGQADGVFGTEVTSELGRLAETVEFFCNSHKERSATIEDQLTTSQSNVFELL